MTEETHKPKIGRPPIENIRDLKTRGVTMLCTQETHDLLKEVRKIQDLSTRQIFDRALRDYIRNTPELAHLLKK